MPSPIPSTPAPLSLSQRLRREPHAFELMQALLLLERERPHAAPPGTGGAPGAEAVLLRGTLTPRFFPSQIESLTETRGGAPVLATPVFGLGGPDGPLPYVYQEWLQECARQKNPAPMDFLDLFHHRLLGLLYRTCHKHRIAPGFTPPSAAPVATQLRALTGLLPKALRHRLPLPDAAILARVALCSGGRRSLAGFALLVRGHFRLPACAEAYAGGWREIPPDGRSRLRPGSPNLCLGRDAVAGVRVWDEHAGIRLILGTRSGPLSGTCAARFLPDGADHPALAALAAFYFGPDLDCALTLFVCGAVPLRLDRRTPPKLSWNGGLRRRSNPDSGSDAIPYRIDTRLRPARMH